MSYKGIENELMLGNTVFINGKLTPVEPNILIALLTLENNFLDAVPLDEDYIKSKGWKRVNKLYDGSIVYEGTPYLTYKNGVVLFSFKHKLIEFRHQFENMVYLLTGNKI